MLMCVCMCICVYVHMHSLVPRPHLASITYSVEKWGEPGIFAQGKWRKFSEQTDCILHIAQVTICSTLGVYDNRPLLARYMQ